MAKSKRVMQVEHEGETMWLYDNGNIRNDKGHLKGHLKGQGEVPQSYTDGLKRLAENTEELVELGVKAQAIPRPEELPEPPPPPPEIKDPPMNDLQVVVNLGVNAPEGFEVSYSKSMVVGSHNIKVISGQMKHQLRNVLERVILQANEDLRAIRDAPLVEQYKIEAERDAKKAAQKKELKDLLKAI